MVDEQKDYGKMRVTFEIERTWKSYNTDESMAKSIANTYLGPQGFKISKIEIGIPPRDQVIIDAFTIIKEFLQKNLDDNMSPIYYGNELEKLLVILKEMMKVVR